MYGLKGAPKGFGDWLDTQVLEKEEFRATVADPCLFYNVKLRSLAFKHMDDFAVAGSNAELDSLLGRWQTTCRLKVSEN